MTDFKGALNHGDQAAREVSKRTYGAVDAETDLDNIPTTSRYDGMIAVVLADQTLWIFDKDSSATETSGSVRQPASGTGRWLKVGSSLLASSAIQSGTSTLATGTKSVSATITSTSRIIITMKDPGAGAITGFAAFDVPVGTRVVGAPGTFVVNAIDDSKATIATAVCTFDWLVIN